MHIRNLGLLSEPQTEQKHFKIAAFPPHSFSCFMVMFSNYRVFCVKSVWKKHLQAAFFFVTQSYSLNCNVFFSQIPSLPMQMSFFPRSLYNPSTRRKAARDQKLDSCCNEVPSKNVVTRGPKRANPCLFFPIPLCVSVLGTAVWPL